MKKQLYRAAAATVLGLSLTTGVVAADTGHIETTGPYSRNTIHSRVHNSARITNNNDINVRNTNDQRAESGDARVSGNTHGGSAETGSASNENETNVDVQVDNSSSSNLGMWHGNGGVSGGGGSIEDTGPHSDNRIDTSVNNTLTVTNNNDIHVTNTNNQRAESGNATVSGNTHGGSATTGDAYNSNSSSFSISVSN